MTSKPIAPDANVIINSVVPDDPYIECPYNKSHQILKSRIQYHLVKCKRQANEEKRLVCPFDATHHITRREWSGHLENCPNRKLVDALVYQIGVNNETMAYEEESNAQEEATEDEEEEEDKEEGETWNDVNAPAYNPFQSTQNSPVIRIIIGATRAERKAFRQCERKRMENLLRNNNYN